MATALQYLVRGAKVGGEVSDAILGIGYGVANAIVLDKMPIGFLFLNILVPVASAFGVPIPRSIKTASYNNLGLVIGLLLFGKK